MLFDCFVCSKESDYIARNFINFFILTQTQIFPRKQQTLILTFKKAIKNAQMNIRHFRVALFNVKISGKIVTPYSKSFRYCKLKSRKEMF